MHCQRLSRYLTYCLTTILKKVYSLSIKISRHHVLVFFMTICNCHFLKQSFLLHSFLTHEYAYSIYAAYGKVHGRDCFKIEDKKLQNLLERLKQNQCKGYFFHNGDREYCFTVNPLSWLLSNFPYHNEWFPWENKYKYDHFHLLTPSRLFLTTWIVFLYDASNKNASQRPKTEVWCL